MAVYAGTRVIKDGLILQLDAANVKNSLLDSVEYLIVGGGGGGASRHGGGGGAGGVLQGRIPVSAQPYNIVVGAGGAGALSNSQSVGSKGENSSAFGLTAFGGGAGGGESAGNSLQNGGSGGGSRGNSVAPGGLGTLGQGSNGGDGTLQTLENFGFGSGGGGAGGRGFTAEELPKGRGGPGVPSSISGTLTFYGGGGGAGGSNPPSASQLNVGGIGGGGNGNTELLDNATAGTPGTGGGGGGGGHADAVNWNGQSGGSGIAIIRYAGPQRATGGVVTRVGADTVHTFTAVGTSTFTVLPAYANAQEFTAAVDFSNSGNVVIAQNGPIYTTDNNGSFVFDGLNDYLLLPTNFWNHSTGNPFTISLFFKTNSARGTILGQQNTNTAGTATGYIPGIYIGTDGRLRTSCFWGGATTNLSTSTNSVADNQWYNIAVTFSAGTQISYLNGISYATLSKTQTSYTTDYFYFIGSGASSGWTSSGSVWFSGSISNFSFYNRALTAQEIQQNFEATRGRYGL